MLTCAHYGDSSHPFRQVTFDEFCNASRKLFRSEMTSDNQLQAQVSAPPNDDGGILHTDSLVFVSVVLYSRILSVSYPTGFFFVVFLGVGFPP